MISATLRSASCTLLVFLLLFCPLAFGTVENWSYFTLECIAAISLLLYSLSLALPDAGKPVSIPGRTPLLLLLGYMLLHLLPLPLPLVKFLSPATYEMYKPLLDLAPEITSIPLTVSRKATLLQFLTASAYVLCYFLTIQHCSQARCLKRMVAIIVGLGMLIAVEAILQKLTAGGQVYWFRATPNSSPVGPWVYSNHFAGYMEMVFPLAIALFLYYRPRVAYETSLREKCLAALTMPGANWHLLLGAGSIIMATSILLSVSRGGIITLCLAFLFFVLFSMRITADPRTRWAIILVILVVLFGTWFGWDPITKKFGNLWGDAGFDTAGRLPVALDSLEIIRSFPLTGSGFGTFIHVYPMVRTVAGDVIFDHAHNDYIEILADGGAIAMALCGWFVVSVLAHTIRALIRRRERYSILLTSGALTGMLALLFHSLADFQMYNGANGLYFFVLCGLTVSAVNTRLQFKTNHTLLPHSGRKSMIVPALLAILLCTLSLWYRIQSVKAESLIAPLQAVFLNYHLSRDRLGDLREIVAQAEEMDPLTPFYPFAKGNLSTLLNSTKEAEREYLKAALMQPTSGELLQQFGASLMAADPERSRSLLSLGLKREPLVLERYLYFSDRLLDWKFRKDAQQVLTRALTALPWRTHDTIQYIMQRGFTVDELRDILPPLPAAWHEAGKRLEGAGSSVAGPFYLHSLDLLDSKTPPLPDYFSRPYSLFLREKRDSTALAILRRGIEALPNHVPFRILLGDYYLRQRITYRALEEYRQAQQLDPNNREVLRKIEQLDQQE